MSEQSFVIVKERKPFIRIVEEGIYNIKQSDYKEGTDSILKENKIVLGVFVSDLELNIDDLK